MLRRLAIRDVVLIDRLDLDCDGGLSVLTGETGAGKSILLDALGLAIGARADAGLVRKGADTASVTAAFELPAGHPALARAAAQGIGVADGELLLRRVVGTDGRSRAFVNDEPASVGLLRELGGMLVEIHGQFDTHGLLDPAAHRAALDAYAALGPAVAALSKLHAGWRATLAAEAEAEAAFARATEEEAFLTHALQELDALSPKPGEAEELATKRALLGQGQKLGEAITAALADLNAGKGVEGALRAAGRALERVAPLARGALDRAVTALDNAASSAADALAEVETLGQSLDLDPQALERTEERLFALRALARKHHVEPDALAGLRDTLQARLDALGDASGTRKRLAAATAGARKAYADAAAKIADARAEAAKKLDRAVARELAPLKLEKARFRTSLTPLDEEAWGPEGTERVAFEVATIPGVEPGPLHKIASGGELARFMLALRVVLARTRATATLVFDEVDSGVGGATADAVGERLARLARDVQVLVVTHSPQVAARGRSHWRVARKRAGGGLATAVEPLAAADRREEIARMLSGSAITDAARAAAASLLAGAAS
ncbi:MAG: DNA repair protein RecN [Alphaproteobacteria bacterium]|nr:DNA repair protein RecN [Alphaproteobacteria bacterium]